MENIKKQIFNIYYNSRKAEEEYNKEILETAKMFNVKIRECNDKNKIEKYEKMKETTIYIDEKCAYAEREVQRRMIELYATLTNKLNWVVRVEFEKEYENSK